MNRILRPGRNCQGIYPVDRCGVLVDGRNYFRAFYDVARHARRYICITGWQFERSTPLLRGADATGAPAPVVVSSFLDTLCARNPDLHVYILMWDFSPLVAFDREWFNKLVLDLTTNERIRFRFDSSHALYASHHQKLVVVDGLSAFVGGLDIAANSWDDRVHWSENAYRVLAGEHYEPYHDVQTLCTGTVAWELTRFFEQRWMRSGGEALNLPQPSGDSAQIPVRKLLLLAGHQVAVSETRAQTLLPLLGPVLHIRRLYLDAIAAAEKLIYIENQYFTSHAVYRALIGRMTDARRACPQIVLVLPKRMHTLIEDISLSVLQAKLLRSLRRVADARGRSLGIYYTASALKQQDPEKATYIHSKVLIVDDRFLSVGSANVSNRSMGMDTELNLSWEAGSGQEDLARSIRRVRASLLMEHAGLRRLSERRQLALPSRLVEFLDGHADRDGCRLRKHIMSSFLEDVAWMKDVMPDDIAIDPETPLIEESIHQVIARDRNSIFSRGLLLLNELAQQQPRATGPIPSTGMPLPPDNTGRDTLRFRKRLRFTLIAIAVVFGIAALVSFLLGR